MHDGQIYSSLGSRRRPGPEAVVDASSPWGGGQLAVSRPVAPGATGNKGDRSSLAASSPARF
jgi:hypothetical protein